MSTAISSTNQAGIGGLFLPAHLVAYIGSFFKVNFRPYLRNLNSTNISLNLYKAFESIACEGVEEDPLRYYKAEVQSHLTALLALELVMREEHDYTYGLNHRDIMYIFDCIYCDSAVIIYGEDTYKNLGDDLSIVDTTHRQHIDNEFLDCSEFTNTLALTHLGMQPGLADEINIKLYKYLRLLEEALRLKRTGLIAYIKNMMTHTLFADMLLYIYIKHNHKLYAPKWYSLAADDHLLALLEEAGILSEVLGMAIRGKRDYYVCSEAALKNVVEPNLEVVQKIVPRYISADSEVIPYDDFWDEDERRHFVTMTAPYYYWLGTYTIQVGVSVLGEENRFIQFTGSDAIGVYLKSCLDE
jgi:hypothetical protein